MSRLLIGVISDTHNLLRPEAAVALLGADHILHAGDVGNPAILDRLREIAPVTAIRGNIDAGGACGHLPATEVVDLGGCSFYMLHDRMELDLDPVAAGFCAVISGHSHKPLLEWRKDVLYFNPGAAGPRRFQLPVSVGTIEIVDRQLRPSLIELKIKAPR